MVCISKKVAIQWIKSHVKEGNKILYHDLGLVNGGLIAETIGGYHQVYECTICYDDIS